MLLHHLSTTSRTTILQHRASLLLSHGAMSARNSVTSKDTLLAHILHLCTLPFMYCCYALIFHQVLQHNRKQTCTRTCSELCATIDTGLTPQTCRQHVYTCSIHRARYYTNSSTARKLHCSIASKSSMSIHVHTFIVRCSCHSAILILHHSVALAACRAIYCSNCCALMVNLPLLVRCTVHTMPNLLQYSMMHGCSILPSTLPLLLA
jgi:hypothetical protein